jgi:hypothetical protein
LDASNVISLRSSVSRGNSAWPAGNLPVASINARISAYCCRLRLPGLFCGIAVRVRSIRSPSVIPFQFALKVLPTSGGAISPPSSMGPWQAAHACA